jgi:hypothetical protein
MFSLSINYSAWCALRQLNLIFTWWKKDKFRGYLHNIKLCASNKKIEIVGMYVITKNTHSKFNHSIYSCNEG